MRVFYYPETVGEELISGLPVEIALVTGSRRPGFRATKTVGVPVETETDIYGRIEIDLAPNFGANAIIDPVGSRYRITERHSALNRRFLDATWYARLDGNDDIGAIYPVDLAAYRLADDAEMLERQSWRTIDAVVVNPVGGAGIYNGFDIGDQGVGVWADFPTNNGGSVGDIVLPDLAPGDRIRVEAQGCWFAPAPTIARLDVATVVNDAWVNSITHGRPPAGIDAYPDNTTGAAPWSIAIDLLYQDLVSGVTELRDGADPQYLSGVTVATATDNSDQSKLFGGGVEYVLTPDDIANDSATLRLICAVFPASPISNEHAYILVEPVFPPFRFSGRRVG